jgi:hypothetical protein
MRHVLRTFWFWLLVITTYAGVLRIYQLGEYPRAFNRDEMVMGYDGWSLWRTHRDHHGQYLPIHFLTFQDNVPPVMNYITAPFVGLLGLDEFTTRLPTALLSIATVFLVGLIGRRWFGSLAGLFAALFFAISPWSMNYGRIALPGSSIPFFIALSLYTFTCGVSGLDRLVGQSRDEDGPTRLSRRSLGVAVWFIASGASFALFTGTYPPMKGQGPLLVITCSLAALLLFIRYGARKYAVLWLISYALVGSPLFIDNFVRWETIQTRYDQVSIFSLPDWQMLIVRLYLRHYDPARLFLTGFGGAVQVLPTNLGQLYLTDGLLSLIAVAAFIRGSRGKLTAFSLPVLLGLWFITYPIADSITQGDSASDPGPHETRAINLLPLPQLVTGYGAALLITMAKRRFGKYGPKLAVGGSAVLVGGLLIYFHSVFIPHFFDPLSQPNDAQVLDPLYNVGLREILNETLGQSGKCDTLWLEWTNQTYLNYLFMTRYPPEQFQSIYWSVISDYFGSVGDVHFGLPDWVTLAPGRLPQCARKPHVVYFLSHREPLPANWTDNWTRGDSVFDARGDAAWTVYYRGVPGDPPWK